MRELIDQSTLTQRERAPQDTLFQQADLSGVEPAEAADCLDSPIGVGTRHDVHPRVTRFLAPGKGSRNRDTILGLGM
jgi:hypothetical protein